MGSSASTAKKPSKPQKNNPTVEKSKDLKKSDSKGTSLTESKQNTRSSEIQPSVQVQQSKPTEIVKRKDSISSTKTNFSAFSNFKNRESLRTPSSEEESSDSDDSVTYDTKSLGSKRSSSGPTSSSQLFENGLGSRPVTSSFDLPRLEWAKRKPQLPNIPGLKLDLSKLKNEEEQDDKQSKSVKSLKIKSNFVQNNELDKLISDFEGSGSTNAVELKRPKTVEFAVSNDKEKLPSILKPSMPLVLTPTSRNSQLADEVDNLLDDITQSKHRGLNRNSSGQKSAPNPDEVFGLIDEFDSPTGTNR